MAIIDEIREAEEKAEKMKKDAELRGQQLVENEKKSGTEKLLALENEKEEWLKKELAAADAEIDKKIKELEQKYTKEVNRIRELAEQNSEEAVKKVQEIILRWPLSP